MEMEVMGSGYGGDGWWLSGSHVSPIFLPYKHVYKSKIKIFYDTMKYKKINDGIFKILRLHGKYFSRSFHAL